MSKNAKNEGNDMFDEKYLELHEQQSSTIRVKKEYFFLIRF